MKVSIDVGDAPWMIGWCSGIASNFAELWLREGPQYRKEVDIEVLRFRRLESDRGNTISVTVVVALGVLARKEEIDRRYVAEKFPHWEASYPSALLKNYAEILLRDMRLAGIRWFSDARTVSEKVLTELQTQ